MAPLPIATVSSKATGYRRPGCLTQPNRVEHARTRTSRAAVTCKVAQSVQSELIASQIAATLQKTASPTPQQRPPVPKVNPAKVLVFILGGGAGADLYPLTRFRAEPAVPLLGSYRLVDIPVSNCLNSGLNKVYVLAQYNTRPLNRHLVEAYFAAEGGFTTDPGFVETLNATLKTSGTGSASSWFQGTADAVRQFLWLLNDTRFQEIEQVLVLCSDHLYRMNYMDMLNKHRASGADISVACLPCTAEQATQFGVMAIEDDMRVTAFQEKPCSGDLECLSTDTTLLGLTNAEAAKRPYAASMGMYVFNPSVLSDLLLKRFPDAKDFSRQVLAPAAADIHIQAYPFTGFWRDVGTLQSFFDAHMTLATSCKESTAMDLWNGDEPVYTNRRVMPISKVMNSDMEDTLMGHGCTINGSRLKTCVIGDCTHIAPGCDLEEVVTFGSDVMDLGNGVQSGIAANCILRRVIVDKDCAIGEGSIITNKAGVKEAMCEDKGYCIRNGIVVILKGAVLPPGTVI